MELGKIPISWGFKWFWTKWQPFCSIFEWFWKIVILSIHRTKEQCYQRCKLMIKTNDNFSHRSLTTCKIALRSSVTNVGLFPPKTGFVEVIFSKLKIFSSLSESSFSGKIGQKFPKLFLREDRLKHIQGTDKISSRELSYLISLNNCKKNYIGDLNIVMDFLSKCFNTKRNFSFQRSGISLDPNLDTVSNIRKTL